MSWFIRQSELRIVSQSGQELVHDATHSAKLWGFKRTLARWRFSPIRKRMGDLQPIIERLESTSLKSHLSCCCQYKNISLLQLNGFKLYRRLYDYEIFRYSWLIVMRFGLCDLLCHSSGKETGSCVE